MHEKARGCGARAPCRRVSNCPESVESEFAEVEERLVSVGSAVAGEDHVQVIVVLTDNAAGGLVSPVVPTAVAGDAEGADQCARWAAEAQLDITTCIVRGGRGREGRRARCAEVEGVESYPCAIDEGAEMRTSVAHPEAVTGVGLCIEGIRGDGNPDVLADCAASSSPAQGNSEESDKTIIGLVLKRDMQVCFAGGSVVDFHYTCHCAIHCYRGSRTIRQRGRDLRLDIALLLVQVDAHGAGSGCGWRGEAEVLIARSICAQHPAVVQTARAADGIAIRPGQLVAGVVVAGGIIAVDAKGRQGYLR